MNMFPVNGMAPFSYYKTCLDCLSIREMFFCDGWYYEMIHEYLYEHIQEMKGEISEDCIKCLPPKAREMVCEMIEKVWGRLK